MPLTLPALLDHRAALHPDREALLVPGGGSLTYGRWRERAVRAAHGLARAGVRPGDRVALLLDNREWDAYAVAFLAAHYAGAAGLVIRADLSGADVARLVDAAGARWAIAGNGPHTALPTFTLDDLEGSGDGEGSGAEPPHRAAPGDLAQIIGTSGTTGTPKGVRAAHASLTAGLVLNPAPARTRTRATRCTPSRSGPTPPRSSW